VKPSDMKAKAPWYRAASGLGKGTALALARAGADVCIVDMNASGLEETASAVRELGAKTHIPPYRSVEGRELSRRDRRRRSGLRPSRCAMQCCRHYRIHQRHEMVQADWEKTIAVNLSAPFYLIQGAIPHLLEVNGAVVNVTSSGAIIGEAYLGAYCASKAGLMHLTRALSMEYMHKPIRFKRGCARRYDYQHCRNIKMPADVNYDLVKRFSGLRGVVEVDDVAELIAFLASDAARGYHGACISIDKGITAG